MKIFSQGWSNGFDGPGRRLVFYLKGCNFACLWCGNPESISRNDEMLFYPEKSKFATESCPHSAVTEGGVLDRQKCSNCTGRECVNVWHDPAFEISGRDISVDALVEEVLERRELFGADGGVTFSGGEPTLQWDELIAAAERLKREKIHLAIESNATSPHFAELENIFDMIFCDLKCVSRDLHIKMTGISNDQVLKNLLLPMEKIIRIPLIKELNFTPDEQPNMIDFLKQANPMRVELLRLHQLGIPKYNALGIKSKAEAMHAPELEEINAFVAQINDCGINCNLQS